MEAVERKQIIDLIKNEVVPAIGCTEPVAVALAVAKAKETLGSVPERIEVLLSDNVLKNAMGVGIPGTGMIGLPISIALGALIGKSEYGLEVLKDVNADSIEKGKQMIDEKRISIKRKTGITEKLYRGIISSKVDSFLQLRHLPYFSSISLTHLSHAIFLQLRQYRAFIAFPKQR